MCIRDSSKRFQNVGIIRGLLGNLKTCELIEVVLALVINFILLFSVVDDDEIVTTMNFSWFGASIGNTATCVLVNIIASAILVLDLLAFAGQLLQRSNMLVKRGYRQSAPEAIIDWDCVMGKYDGAQALEATSHLALTTHPTTWLEGIRSVYYVLRDPHCSYWMLAAAMSVVGLAVDPLAYSFHLIGLFLYFPELQDVLLSVARPAKTMLLVLLLLCIIIYMFSLVAFKFFSTDYNGGCETLVQCYRVTFDQGFKNDGGIGGYLTDLSLDSGSTHILGRFIFDHLFNILLMILLLNILFGIIIDTFALLRDENEQRKRDMLHSCTICSISKSTFDRQTPLGHTYHIKGEHNMWHYCCLFWHLKSKTDTEYTGIESYLAESTGMGDLRCFPVHRAMSLGGGQVWSCLLYTSPSPRDRTRSRMPSSA
eukprot:TRINITY_DN11731_c0_g1_i2.p1 TRINITY_DN11731_c0_g1~~TRINITY_DN11731_c0_g1_i2.p1  ORF type:complete len:425 (-),score=119.83 TRINITY_DN11731_c0_g1_i2:42-1316(-)